MFKVSKSIIKKDEKFLLLKRAVNSKHFPNLWDFPGGKHEPGETSKESVIRETFEETSFNIKPENEIFKQEYHDEKFDILFHYFKPKIVSGELKLSDDHSEYAWFSKEEMKSLNLHPSVIIFLNKE